MVLCKNYLFKIVSEYSVKLPIQSSAWILWKTLQFIMRTPSENFLTDSNVHILKKNFVFFINYPFELVWNKVIIFYWIHMSIEYFKNCLFLWLFLMWTWKFSKNMLLDVREYKLMWVWSMCGIVHGEDYTLFQNNRFKLMRFFLLFFRFDVCEVCSCRHFKSRGKFCSFDRPTFMNFLPTAPPLIVP